MFDVIFSVETIEHMATKDASILLSSLNKALNVGGYLIITTPILKRTNMNPTNKFHFIEYSDNDFTSLLNSHGFSIEKKEFVQTTFTDGKIKDQGYYRCRKSDLK